MRRYKIKIKDQKVLKDFIKEIGAKEIKDPELGDIFEVDLTFNELKTKFREFAPDIKNKYIVAYSNKR